MVDGSLGMGLAGVAGGAAFVALAVTLLFRYKFKWTVFVRLEELEVMVLTGTEELRRRQIPLETLVAIGRRLDIDKPGSFLEKEESKEEGEMEKQAESEGDDEGTYAQLDLADRLPEDLKDYLLAPH